MNLLFKSDNLLALKRLTDTHTDSIKCAYLDPPYNTGVDRKHFKDTRQSQDWLQMMKERIELIFTLLREDGSLWISIDDSELYPLKLLCDQIFGKENFLANIIWQHSIAWKDYQGKFKLDHTYILGYRKSSSFAFANNAVPKTVWLESEVGGQADAIRESAHLFGENNVFSTPKPEKLMSYLIALTTHPGDIILDGFSGSGTLGAAAHKMGRQWIMIEIGDQCDQLIIPRLNSLKDVSYTYVDNLEQYNALSTSLPLP